ncbi:MAG TPA: hypothetical protein VGP15_01500 [Burkholderiales bacterium]|jgi:hypothetical protein|nr:hypothetical protein [Burkholderiales bacterium]
MDSINTRIRIRSTLSRAWIWELVTRDGHVANASTEFATREECEGDARKQGLPISGLRRGPRLTAEPKPVRQEPGSWKLHKDDSGLWHWQRVDDRAAVVDVSRCAFLTREECVSDARKNGYTAEPEPIDDA